ncbi:MAG: protein translocase subunit SecF [Leptonema sp. (in: bacteria)]
MKILENRKFFLMFSLLLVVLFYSITFGYYKGFAKSITFDGGIRITLILPKEKEKKFIETKLKESGFKEFIVRLVDPKENKYDIEFGPEVREEIRKQVKDDKKITEELEKRILPNLEIPVENIISREIISASYGSNLFKISLKALVWAIILITVYVSFRFRFSFALGATIALIHDLVITIGFIGVYRIQPSIPVVAAILTLLGYSINDTIIIFDRIRSKMKDEADLLNFTLLNSAIVETFSRTIITSFLTALSLIAIIIINAETLIDFSLILIFGILIGTYSSIFIATPVMYYYERFRQSRTHKSTI